MGSKFPDTETLLPANPTVGVKLVIVGRFVVVTVKDPLDVADPAGAVTATVPAVAPVGTVVINLVGVAETTVAAVPLNVTEFWLGVLLKLVPLTVTVLPTGPLLGTREMMVTCARDGRVIEVILPTAS